MRMLNWVITIENYKKNVNKNEIYKRLYIRHSTTVQPAVPVRGSPTRLGGTVQGTSCRGSGKPCKVRINSKIQNGEKIGPKSIDF